MKLAIVNLTSGSLSGGYIKYLNYLVPRISKNPNIELIKVYVPPQAKEKLVKISSPLLLTWPERDHNNGFRWLKKNLLDISYDVIFIPTARLLKYRAAPCIYMVRNMEPLTVPFGGNPIFESIKNIGRYLQAKRACLNATRIIAVSNHVKCFLIEKWHIDPEHIGVVYHGIDLPIENFKFNVPSFANKIQGHFIFTAGSIRPARGLEDILIAFSKVYVKNPNLKLVIAGSTDPGMDKYRQRLEALIKYHSIDHSVLWTGPLTQDEMQWCYNNCQIFVMTSRAEACPNIALEAMAHGCICVSTETPPMPEFFRDAAVYYSPKNSEVLADRIIDVLSWDIDKKKEMSEKAKQRAAQFSWDVCAKKTIEQFQIAIEEFKTSQKFL